MKLPKNDMWFILAAFNEEKRITKTIKDLKKEGYNNLVVIDDGSEDNTYELAKKEKVHVLKHPVNRGQGAALRSGIEYALRKKAKYIIHFDADGQHRVQDIPAMIKPVLEGKAEIALGSRYLDKNKKTKMPIHRTFYLKGGLWFTKLMTGLKLTDTHNGFRAMTAKAARELKITQDEMEHASEILELIARKKVKYKEVPVIITYNEEVMENSTNSFKMGVQIILKTIHYKFFK
jgi:glycosyltransferase involved in cell wall biosynthesis